MKSPSSPHPPRYSIVQTEKGWCLVIQNEHCSVTQVFSSAAAAGRAVDRMLEFFDTMSTQAPGSRQGGLSPAHTARL
jgi:hypothetical protein